MWFFVTRALKMLWVCWERRTLMIRAEERCGTLLITLTGQSVAIVSFLWTVKTCPVFDRLEPKGSGPLEKNLRRLLAPRSVCRASHKQGCSKVVLFYEMLTCSLSLGTNPSDTHNLIFFLLPFFVSFVDWCWGSLLFLVGWNVPTLAICTTEAWRKEICLMFFSETRLLSWHASTHDWILSEIFQCFIWNFSIFYLNFFNDYILK